MVRPARPYKHSEVILCAVPSFPTRLPTIPVESEPDLIPLECLSITHGPLLS